MYTRFENVNKHVEVSPPTNNKIYRITSKARGVLVLGALILVAIFLCVSNSYSWTIYLSEYNKQFLGATTKDGLYVNDEHIVLNKKSDETLAQQLFNEVKIICWILTNSTYHMKKAIHVKNTWGSRCNKLIFMSDKEDEQLGAIALPVKEGRNHLWAKTKEAFKYIYSHHLNEADWFVKADDDTYMIVENLRYMLYPYSPDTPIYFGCKFKPYVKQGYMSGGAGYVLSKEAVKRFVEDALPDEEKCRNDSGGSEDLEIGKCLENVNVIAGDSRDSFGRERFFPLDPTHYVFPNHAGKDYWLWKYIFYDINLDSNSYSDSVISFHYVVPEQMHILDFLIYLRPFGVNTYSRTLPPRIKSISDSIISGN